MDAPVDHAALNNIANRVRTCTRCRLHQGRTHAVPGEGAGHNGHPTTQATLEPAAPPPIPAFSGAMLVGEAPGRKEDESGRPFCGAAGKNLDKGLAAANIPRETVFVTSIIKCRPPNNRDPRPDEKEACRPYLLEQIDALRPRVLVALGRHGLSALIDNPPKAFSEVRGRFIEGPRGIPVFCSLHPAAVIYRRIWLEDYLEDWQRFGDWLRSGNPAPLGERP